jgi:hypothetical protein
MENQPHPLAAVAGEGSIFLSGYFGVSDGLSLTRQHQFGTV